MLCCSASRFGWWSIALIVLFLNYTKVIATKQVNIRFKSKVRGKPFNQSLSLWSTSKKQDLLPIGIEQEEDESVRQRKSRRLAAEKKKMMGDEESSEESELKEEESVILPGIDESTIVGEALAEVENEIEDEAWASSFKDNNTDLEAVMGSIVYSIVLTSDTEIVSSNGDNLLSTDTYQSQLVDVLNILAAEIVESEESILRFLVEDSNRTLSIFVQTPSVINEIREVTFQTPYALPGAVINENNIPCPIWFQKTPLDRCEQVFASVTVMLQKQSKSEDDDNGNNIALRYVKANFQEALNDAVRAGDLQDILESKYPNSLVTILAPGDPTPPQIPPLLVSWGEEDKDIENSVGDFKDDSLNAGSLDEDDRSVLEPINRSTHGNNNGGGKGEREGLLTSSNVFIYALAGILSLVCLGFLLAWKWKLWEQGGQADERQESDAFSGPAAKRDEALQGLPGVYTAVIGGFDQEQPSTQAPNSFRRVEDGNSLTISPIPKGFKTVTKACKELKKKPEVSKTAPIGNDATTAGIERSSSAASSRSITTYSIWQGISDAFLFEDPVPRAEIMDDDITLVSTHTMSTSGSQDRRKWNEIMDSTKAAEMEQMIEQGNWEAIMEAARRYEAEADSKEQYKQERSLSLRLRRFSRPFEV